MHYLHKRRRETDGILLAALKHKWQKNLQDTQFVLQRPHEEKKGRVVKKMWAGLKSYSPPTNWVFPSFLKKEKCKAQPICNDWNFQCTTAAQDPSVHYLSGPEPRNSCIKSIASAQCYNLFVCIYT